ncbi:hybrid sensor histidine kinase/response regulator [Paenibacillus sabuli]|uniref:hybrid sensor histidine kinase/response regulator n=1 Tax=Paenibacillus sabuli TaxID=2772509 RepID=UPI00295AA1AC|nr:ATP-binding protein [Paenibacillus sabuli]
MKHKHTKQGLAFLTYGALFLLFLGLLAGARWLWMQAFETAPATPSVNGIVHMEQVELENAPPFFLDGQWQFYPGTLLHARDERPADAETVAVPGNWTNAPGRSDEDHAYGYGTYRLIIRTQPLARPVSLWLSGIQSASEVEINGQLAGSSGQPSSEPSTYVPLKTSYVATYFDEGATELEVLIRVANFDDADEGGMLASVRFGAQSSIAHMRELSIQFQVAIFFILLLHGLYACILFLIHQERTLLYTALLVAAVGLLIVSGYDQVIYDWLPLAYDQVIRMRWIAFLWQNTLILMIFRRLLHQADGTRLHQALLAALGAASLTLVFVPDRYLYDGAFSTMLALVGYVPLVGLVPVLLRMLGRLRQDRDMWFLLLTAAGILANLGWRTFGTAYGYQGLYYPVDVLVTIAGFSTYWFVKYFRNARENAALNEQLRAEAAHKDQFLANTSHELRTPLHGIMNLTQSVVNRQEETMESDSRRDLDTVLQISRRMSHMLDNLLDIARLKASRIRLQLEPLRMQAVVPGVLGMFKVMLEGKPIELRMELPPHLPAVSGDERRLVQVLYNLIHNAIKYTERGSVVVKAEERDGRIRMVVADTGIGMDEATRARALLPYEQGEAGLRDGRGLGLGLSICSQLVELHGGELRVSSEPGAGSVFSFELPMAAHRDADDAQGTVAAEPVASALRFYALADRREAQQGDEGWQLASGHHAMPLAKEAAAAAERPLAPGAPARILAVDDDPVNLDVLSRMLDEQSYRLDTATSGAQALERAASGGWDLVIADVMMPGMSGYELTERLRVHYSALELPIVLLTARSQSADIYTGFAAGANDYLAKPVDPIELRARVKALVTVKRGFQDRLRWEAAYLQAQIQPHFLFNTLNSIAALVEIDTKRMTQMINAFAAYLRISFDYLNTDELAPLSRELELVESYLHIEKERFRDRLAIVWEIAVDTSLMLPPLSIQPLVENAVHHGLLAQSKGGTLTIRIVEREAGIHIAVEDDGKGMDEATVRALLSPAPQGRRGVGVANTHSRLVRLYGQGLTIKSRVGAGTKVSFNLPGGA